MLVFVNFDAKRFQKLEILVVDFEFGISGESGDEGGFVGGFFALFTYADGGFEDEENIIAAFFDAGDNFGDLFRIGKRFIDGFAEFFHELFQLLVHVVPRSPTALAQTIPLAT